MPSSSKKRKQTQTRDFKARAKLKSLGLISKRVDLRKKITRGQRVAINKYSGVLNGSEKIVKAPSKKVAKQFGRIFKIKDEKIIIPVERGERPKFDKASGNIVSHRVEYGREREKIIRAETPSAATVEKGKNVRYVLPLARGKRITRFSFLTFQELEDFVYKDTLGRSFKNWADYVEIEKIGKRVKGRSKKKIRRSNSRRVEIRQRDEDESEE